MKINIIGEEEWIPTESDYRLTRGLHREVVVLNYVLKNYNLDIRASYFGRDLNTTDKYDVNIFVEKVNPIWFKTAEKNILLPNQEWFYEGWIKYLPNFDLILCKTRYAEESFKRYTNNTVYTSFTSPDCFDSTVEKDIDSWVHVVGKAIQKSTNIVEECWEANPNFPHLTITIDPLVYSGKPNLPNLTYIPTSLPLKWLRYFQNKCGVHLCPSYAEAFGHYINEGLSVESLVLTTDGPPMNELITPERGILCRAPTRWPSRMGHTYPIEKETLEESVKRILLMTKEEKLAKAKKGRKFFEENDSFFKKTFNEVIKKELNL